MSARRDQAAMRSVPSGALALGSPNSTTSVCSTRCAGRIANPRVLRESRPRGRTVGCTRGSVAVPTVRSSDHPPRLHLLDPLHRTGQIGRGMFHVKHPRDRGDSLGGPRTPASAARNVDDSHQRVDAEQATSGRVHPPPRHILSGRGTSKDVSRETPVGVGSFRCPGAGKSQRHARLEPRPRFARGGK